MEKQYCPGTEWINEHAFAVILMSKRTPRLSREHNDWKWCNINEAIKMLRHPDNVEGLKRYIDFVQGGSLWTMIGT